MKALGTVSRSWHSGGDSRAAAAGTASEKRVSCVTGHASVLNRGSGVDE